MEHSNVVDMVGWRSLVVQGGLLVVGTFSFVILFSFGGQLIVAPALLPVQWLIAHDTDGWVSSAFSFLGAILLIEVVFIGLLLLLGASAFAVVAVAPVALAGAYVFFRTSQGRG